MIKIVFEIDAVKVNENDKGTMIAQSIEATVNGVATSAEYVAAGTVIWLATHSANPDLIELMNNNCADIHKLVGSFIVEKIRPLLKDEDDFNMSEFIKLTLENKISPDVLELLSQLAIAASDPTTDELIWNQSEFDPDNLTKDSSQDADDIRETNKDTHDTIENKLFKRKQNPEDKNKFTKDTF